MSSSSQHRAAPARRVYYDWDAVSTNPDLRLGAAFEHTQPGVKVDDYGDDEPTLVRWALPALGLLLGGFLIGRWWVTRPAKDGAELVGDDSGFDLLGCET